MAADTSESWNAFSMSEAVAAAAKPGRVEEEVGYLFDQLRVSVLRYLLSFSVPVSDAEEIAQEVFLSLFHHLRQGKPRTNLQGWIFRVAHNSALKWRLKTRREYDRVAYQPGLSETAADGSPGPEENVMASQRRQKLLAVVRALPEQDQCCLSLRAEGLRYREIAEVLGISLGSVAASLEKSLCRLARSEH